MNTTHVIANGRTTLRAAAVLAGLYVALALGVPWLLYDAPPSAEAALASKLCCATAVIMPVAVPVR